MYMRIIIYIFRTLNHVIKKNYFFTGFLGAGACLAAGFCGAAMIIPLSLFMINGQIF